MLLAYFLCIGPYSICAISQPHNFKHSDTDDKFSGFEDTHYLVELVNNYGLTRNTIGPESVSQTHS